MVCWCYLGILVTFSLDWVRTRTRTRAGTIEVGESTGGGMRYVLLN